MKHNQVNKFALCSKAIDTDYIFLNQKLFDKLDLLCAFMRMVALLVFKKIIITIKIKIKQVTGLPSVPLKSFKSSPFYLSSCLTNWARCSVVSKELTTLLVSYVAFVSSSLKSWPH
jgi:hypothetical protein